MCKKSPVSESLHLDWAGVRAGRPHEDLPHHLLPEPLPASDQPLGLEVGGGHHGAQGEAGPQHPRLLGLPHTSLLRDVRPGVLGSHLPVPCHQERYQTQLQVILYYKFA